MISPVVVDTEGLRGLFCCVLCHVQNHPSINFSCSPDIFFRWMSFDECFSPLVKSDTNQNN